MQYRTYRYGTGAKDYEQIVLVAAPKLGYIRLKYPTVEAAQWLDTAVVWLALDRFFSQNDLAPFLLQQIRRFLRMRMHNINFKPHSTSAIL